MQLVNATVWYVTKSKVIIPKIAIKKRLPAIANETVPPVPVNDTEKSLKGLFIGAAMEHAKAWR
ncbi:MAG: hypothetical protein ABJB86_12540 [Bacteroidota bacterium]